MSNDYSEQKKKINKKSFFSNLLNQLRTEEPKNKEELLLMIRKLEKNSIIDHDTSDMLEGAIDITKKKVKDIMIPRTQMITLKINYDFNTCINIIIQSAHSRYPVMSIDNNYVEGLLIAKDLLPFMKKKLDNFCIKKIMRTSIIVPESKNVNRMLKEFRSKHYHMALVIDEFGAVSGLVTIEDILELIVGNIEDEYDTNSVLQVHQINQNSFAIPALTEIKEFNEMFKTNLNDKEVDTIGGLVMTKLGYLPIKGESINIKGYIFKISIADSRKIIQIHVTIPKNKIKKIE
ncbi:Magnesium and cobalt efflux protein CorC [Buchnera aphidicola (Eriosoma grossulariae)]|uniref:CNNM family magnesium/cobalt transport protein CorC n=1 Tax=Buchnera aphidicola TaxID=9 RepID=UPI00346387E2